MDAGRAANSAQQQQDSGQDLPEAALSLFVRANQSEQLSYAWQDKSKLAIHRTQDTVKVAHHPRC
jgi:hypothetical protein